MSHEIVLSEEEIKSLCQKVGKQITEALKNEKKVPVVVGVMKGAVNFMMGLLPYIDCPIFTDYIQISSYVGAHSTGKVHLIKDVSYDLKGRDVILVEDIVDSGYSMQYLIEHMKYFEAKHVYVCALLDKKEGRKVPVNVDFCGKILEGNEFLCGFGLDYNELERNIPYIYKVSKEELEAMNQRLAQDKE